MQNAVKRKKIPLFVTVRSISNLVMGKHRVPPFITDAWPASKMAERHI